MFPLGQGNGGGDGLDFVAGTEIFQFNSNQIQSVKKPSGIYGAWIDATALTSGKNLILKTPYQTVVVAGGSQQYVIFTSPMPFQLTVTTNGGTGVVNIVLYNFNPLFTAAGGAGAPIGGSGSGGGSYGGGGGSGYEGGGGGKPTL